MELAVELLQRNNIESPKAKERKALAGSARNTSGHTILAGTPGVRTKKLKDDL